MKLFFKNPKTFLKIFWKIQPGSSIYIRNPKMNRYLTRTCKLYTHLIPKHFIMNSPACSVHHGLISNSSDHISNKNIKYLDISKQRPSKVKFQDTPWWFLSLRFDEARLFNSNTEKRRTCHALSPRPFGSRHKRCFLGRKKVWRKVLKVIRCWPCLPLFVFLKVSVLVMDKTNFCPKHNRCYTSLYLFF